MSRSRSLRGRTGHVNIEKSGDSLYALQTEISAPVHVSNEQRSRDGRSTKPLRTVKPIILAPTPGDISIRPRTSGSAKAPAWGVEKQARDDIQFNPLRANRVSVISAYYDFPLRAHPVPQSRPPASSRQPAIFTGLPTPEPTPKATPQTAPTSPVTLADTPKHLHSPHPLDLNLIAMHAEALGIGMALGSPSHQPVSQQPVQQIDMDGTTAWTPQEDHRIPASESMPSKQKHSKWKLLGGLFGKKSAASPPVPHQPQPTNLDYKDSYEPHSEPQNSGKSRPARGRTESEPRISPRKPHLKRAHTTQVYGDLENAPTIDESHKLPPAIRLDGGPMLDVDIPSTHMERYSVMFGSVLQRPSNDQPSSLLARRQATLDKLKTVNEAIAAKVSLAGLQRQCAEVDSV